jgi:hypothetical protein
MYRKMRLAGHVARMGEKQNACRILVGEPEGKRPLGRPRRKWGTISEWIIGLYGVDWIDMAHDRDQWRVLVNTALSFRVP